MLLIECSLNHLLAILLLAFCEIIDLYHSLFNSISELERPADAWTIKSSHLSREFLQHTLLCYNMSSASHTAIPRREAVLDDLHFRRLLLFMTIHDRKYLTPGFFVGSQSAAPADHEDALLICTVCFFVSIYSVVLYSFCQLTNWSPFNPHILLHAICRLFVSRFAPADKTGRYAPLAMPFSAKIQELFATHNIFICLFMSFAFVGLVHSFLSRTELLRL